MRKVFNINNWQSLKEHINITDGYAVVMFTDLFTVSKYPCLDIEIEEKLINEFDRKLLDMRIFDKTCEHRVLKKDTDNGFIYRYLSDLEENDYYDDEQFIDIDDKRSEKSFKENNTVRATGGGFYKLPIDNFNNAKIYIRNYVDYDSFGQAYIKDWRLVDLK